MFLAEGQSLSIATERRIHLLARAYHAPAPALFAAFQTADELHLVTTYCPYGSLGNRPGPLSECEVGWWAGQMISAIQWLHEQNYVHR